MTSDDLRVAIDDGDLAGAHAVLAVDPAAVTRALFWSDGRCGGDSSPPISYVSLARFHARAHHDRMGQIARLLLSAGAPADGDPTWDETPIVTAASYDEPAVATALLEAGADVVGRGSAAPGSTALAHAVYFGNPVVADVLVAAGAPINTLAEAAGSGRLHHHPPIDTHDHQARVSALRAAAVCERLDAIDLLLDSGLAVDSEVEGATALHWAAFFGKRAAVQHLVSRGADPQGREAAHDGTPLDWCRYRRGELFRASPGHDAVEEYLTSIT